MITFGQFFDIQEANAQLGSGAGMSPNFAKWYLWAKNVVDQYSDDVNARILLTLMRQLDDLYARNKGEIPVAGNLIKQAEDNTLAVIKKLIDKYPELKMSAPL
jgi:hypothetical protein